MALRPAAVAMVDRAVSAHGYHELGPQEILRLAGLSESIERSTDRCKACPDAAKRLLKQLHESRDFWCGLRRHGTVEQCLKWLETMSLHSTRRVHQHLYTQIDAAALNLYEDIQENLVTKIERHFVGEPEVLLQLLQEVGRESHWIVDQHNHIERERQERRQQQGNRT